MKVCRRPYQIFEDFQKVSEFLTNNYDPILRNEYFLQPFFEYAQNHSAFEINFSHRNAIWEEDGEIVAIAFYEMESWLAFLVIKPDYEYLREEMLQYVESTFPKTIEDRVLLQVWTTDANKQAIKLLEKRGYKKIYEDDITLYNYEKGFQTKQLPEGFKIVSGAELDAHKMYDCLWKGFDNEEPPNSNWHEEEHLLHAPNFRKDLTVAIEAPNGEYACMAGMWLDSPNHYAYLEPLATVPHYRRMGLAAIALMEAMKRTAPFGARYCYGGSGGFYYAIGFEKCGQRQNWEKIYA